MKTILFTLPGNEALAKNLGKELHAEAGEVVIRQFPDGETYVQIRSDVKNKQVVLLCTLHQPDDKLLPLYFLSLTARDLGASGVCLVAPYLAYMRQDKQFRPGEAVTSAYFGALVSHFANTLVTVDPHLHRRSSLSEVYSIPTEVVHAADLISGWIREHVKKPILVGPDSESTQWVSEVAKNAGAPFIVLEKTRLGDNRVKVSVPQVETFADHTPVLVDDIISTGHTMIETVKHLKRAGMKPPLCIGVHAVFAGNAYRDLLDAGVADIHTCNTISHESNRIDVTALLVKGLADLQNKIN